MTEDEVEQLKKNVGMYQPGENYNEIINGHGTGLAPPSTEDYKEMEGSVKVVEHVDSNEPLSGSVDLTEDQYFPPIGNQGSQGSCASWSTAYYANTYMQAKANGWDVSSGGDDHLMSPSWVYNKVNGGSDGGSTLADPMALVETVGNADMQTMPYDDSDHISWGDESAWRDAPQHRAQDYESTSVSNVDVVKSWLSDGFVVSMAVDADQYNFDGDNVLSSQEYNAGSPNHANTVVGYDDSVSDDGETGAFKIANSWGQSWGPNGDGTYYMTYDCFQTLAYSSAYRYTGSLYNGTTYPQMIGATELSSTGPRDAEVELGAGDPDDPSDTHSPQWDGGSHDFPSFMCFDMTTLETDDTYSQYYLHIGSGSGSSTISSFQVEAYPTGYTPGNPDNTSGESSDTPADTPATVIVDFQGGGGNDPPDAAFTYSPDTPAVGETVQFTDQSEDQDGGTITDWSWSFGDGSSSSSQDPTHSYSSEGTYTVELSVTDDDGATATASQTIEVTSDGDDGGGGGSSEMDEDYEDGASGWSTQGLWHLVSDSDQYGDSHSGSNAMWYGKDSTGNYDTGSQTTGSLVSPSIDLTQASQAQLTFYHWYETESYDGEYDKVMVSVNGDQVYYRDSSDPNVGSEGNFVQETVDLSSYVGQTISVSFTFDSMDGTYNDYRGWYVDDIAVSSDDGGGGGGNNAPSASFTYSPTDPSPGDSIQFTDTSSDGDGSISSYSWDFGDGSTSSSQNPTHSYGSEGTYTVSLTVTDNDGATDTASQSIDVSSGGGGGSTVIDDDFENGASGWSTSGLWHLVSDSDQYGDANSGSKAMWYGQDSTGNYATGSRTTGSLSKSVDLSGTSSATLSFSHWFETENYDNGQYDKVIVTVNGNQVYYRDTSDSNVGSENNFVQETIDISSYAGQTVDIKFTFDSMDDYDNDYRGWYVDDVKVTADSGGGGGGNSAPSAYFSYSPSNPSSGETVQFTDSSSDSDGSISSYSWDFGDGSTSSQQDPTHSYGSDGTYTVTLTVTDNEGATSSTSKDITVGSGGGGSTVLDEDFENGASSWSTSGLWHLVSDSDQYGDANSGSKAMWYGQDSTGTYDTGSPTSGSLSASVDLSGASQAELTFQHWFKTESYDGQYDKVIVTVNGNQVYYRDTSDSNVGSENNFVQETIDISSYAGQTVDIKFTFDSVDDYNNGYRGWYVDDVKVTTGTTSPTAVESTDDGSAPLLSMSEQYTSLDALDHMNVDIEIDTASYYRRKLF